MNEILCVATFDTICNSNLKQIAYIITCKHPTIQTSTIKDVLTNFGQFCKWRKKKVKHVQVLKFFYIGIIGHYIITLIMH